VTDRIELPLAGTPFGSSPSFMELVRREHPEAVPGAVGDAPFPVPHGTTVLGLKFDHGVVMAGDRRATAGNIIADAKMRKVFAADDYSVIAIAGAAGQAAELVKLFQLELEHYEKITGDRLSLEGKANRLAQMIRSNFPMALQGFVVVPLFGGFDERKDQGRIFYYDATGGRWDGRLSADLADRRARDGRRRLGRPGGRGHRRGRGRPPATEHLVSFMPYVAPEQLMKDRSEYAHKGIARGRSVIGLEYADGLLFIAENPSATLHKISEIYDQIAFAGVGKYSEFEELRIAGIRLADLRGYQYGREDVKARDLANAYSQALSTIFTQQMKPYEVELLVGEVDGEVDGAGIYHILFDGSVSDEQGFVAMGGHSEDLTDTLRDRYQTGWDLATAVRTAVQALGTTPEAREIPPDQIEAAVVDRTRTQRRKFRRLRPNEVAAALA
jgi:proteasome alpha subunit